MDTGPLTVERAREALTYNPETGELRWKIKISDKINIGDLVTNFNEHGYRRVGIDGRRYLAHRVAWLHHYGRWPEGLLDHCDRDPSNNRINNLREATQAQNLWNRPANINNRHGLKGITLSRESGRWIAQIMANGRAKNLGSFETAEEAHAAYRRAAERLHGEFACASD